MPGKRAKVEGVAQARIRKRAYLTVPVPSQGPLLPPV